MYSAANRIRTTFVVLGICALIASCTKSNSVSIRFDIESDSPRINHGLEMIKALEQSCQISCTDSKADIILTAEVDSSLGKESFAIHSRGKRTAIVAGDDVGVMYALLDIRDALRCGKKRIQDKFESPSLSFRAIKHNLPWSTYRNSEALSLHYDTCRDTLYWRSFLDMMADNRFNVLTLWNLHPFSYMVKSDRFPEACPYDDDQLAEWHQLWTSLFKMAKDRGIETYVVNWNIFVSPEFSKFHNVAKHCVSNYYKGEGDTSEIIKDYTREVVKLTLDEYPDLTGLGITLGEGMGGMSPKERQDWIMDAYIGGLRQASRKAKFIYRVPLSAGTGIDGSTSYDVEKMTRSVLDTLSCFDDQITIELKFNWSHSFSTTSLEKVHGGPLGDTYWNPQPENYSLAWMMRNEDFFMLRWGNTDYLRDHLNRNVQSYVSGYFLGSECYIPAKDYITSVDGSSYRYAFERQWMYYMQVGRLLYNSSTSDEVFIDEFEHRFPSYGRTLFSAQTKASCVPLIIGSYQNETWDFTLYSEGLLHLVERDNGKKETELISLEDMATKTPMDKSYMSIDQYIDNCFEEYEGMISPVHLADSLEYLCKTALYGVGDIPYNSTDLMYEVTDIKAWSYIGLYYSNKLRAAIGYRMFQHTAEREYLTDAIEKLQIAVNYWRELVKVTEIAYDPVPLVHLSENEGASEYFHWSILEDQVLRELDALRKL